MQKFKYNRCKDYGLFLLFSLYPLVVCPMNSPIVSNDFSLKPQKTITIFNPTKDLKIGKSWRDVVPGSIMITPDGKGVVIAESGRVRQSYFASLCDIGPEIIIEHPWVRHSPMVAMSQKKDGSLLIVSAGNYINEEQKRVAEYIVLCNGLSKVHKLDWPIQAIALDPCGEKLAIAGQLSVSIIDCEANKTDRAIFRDSNRENWIVDIAVNAKGSALVAVGNQNEVQYMSIAQYNGDIDLSNIKQVQSNDIIKKIYYPTPVDILYVTDDGKAKIINMYDFIENTISPVESTLFAQSTAYNKVVADQGENIATAHWTDNIQAPKDLGRKIKVYRKGIECIEKFTLEMDTVQERYDYITEFGQYGSGIGHLLQVALRGNRVVALATDGKMRLWSLPENSKLFTEPEIVYQPKDYISGQSIRSNKSRHKKNSFSLSADDASESSDKIKIVSPRLIKLFQTSSAHSSRETSPVSSRGNSPSHSPRRKASASLIIVDEKAKDSDLELQCESKDIKNDEKEII